MKKSWLFFCLLFSPFVNAQVAVSLGATVLKPFGYKEYRPGFNLGFEFLQDESTSIYGRILFTSKVKSIENVNLTANLPSTSPQIWPGQLEIGDRFVLIEGGKRIYFGGSNDFGFSAYGGSTIGGTISSVKTKLVGDFDKDKYYYGVSPDEPLPSKGSILGVHLGLNVGVKNQFNFGTLFLDVSGIYNTSFAAASNTLAQQYGKFSSIMFVLNVGYRRDLLY